MKKIFFALLTLVLFQACGSYKQNIMFQAETAEVISQINDVDNESSSYVVQPNDYLELEVFTKKGEFLIDPENKLLDQKIPNNNLKPALKYLVQQDGSVVLPMVGTIDLIDLTLLEAENKLIKAYETYYKDPFIKLRYVNKRVIVLGAAGDQVIPLVNENTKVLEILASVEGVDKEGKSHNIRLLRGEKAYELDFSSIKGYQKSNLTVQNGDVIYVEPVRRPFSEFIRDNGPIISVFSSLASLVVVIISIK